MGWDGSPGWGEWGRDGLRSPPGATGAMEGLEQHLSRTVDVSLELRVFKALPLVFSSSLTLEVGGYG